MHIKIVGFKIHLDVEFIFNNGEMTLLKGSSGKGKSSVLQAIFWALYGNMRGIYNNARITKNLSVYLSLPGINIFRKKNPELLTVTVEGKTYEDAIAQSIIDNTFGHRELWRACSYIEQKSRCSLLSGSGGERMELLNALSFTGENPKEYINKINNVLKDITLDFEKSQAAFINELNNYTNILAERAIKRLYTEEEIVKLQKNEEDLKQQIQHSYENVIAQERLLGTINYLKNNEKEILYKLENLKKIVFKKLVDIGAPQLLTFQESEVQVPEDLYIPTIKPQLIEKCIISYEEYSKMKNRYNLEMQKILEENAKVERNKKEKKEIETELEKYADFQFKDYKLVTQEEIWNVKKLETERNKNIEECKAIGLQYNEDIIRQTINDLSEQLKSFNILESQIDNYNKLLSIEEKMSEYIEKKTVFANLEELAPANLEELDPANLEELAPANLEELALANLEELAREKSILLSELKKGLELLSCPKCHTSLKYHNGNLYLGEREPVSKDEITRAEKEYNELLISVQKYREFLKLEENRNFLSEKIDRKAIKDYMSTSRGKVTALSQLITRISKIRYIKEDISSETLGQIFKYQTLINKNRSIICEDMEINLAPKLLEDLETLENRYKMEQNRILGNQEQTRKYQQEEDKRLKSLAKYETEKKQWLERKNRIEKENSEKLQKYENEKRKMETEKSIIENEKQRVEAEIISLEGRREEVRKELEAIKLDHTVGAKYNELKEKLEEEKRNIDDAIYTVKTLKFGKELELKRERLLKLQNDVQVLTNLKIKAVDVECKQLEDTVNNINTVLETTLPIFFDEPISLTLQLYKKVKSVETLKPGLNLEICYKGFKYDNINSLSGGEGDRISLALLLALNFVSNSPIILLDECVSSLDGDLKENCITAIKSIPNKTVICIDHDDALEGFYDSVIEIK